MSEDMTLNEFTDDDESVEQEWFTQTLGQLAEYQNGRGFGKEEWGDTGYPIIRIQNLTEQQSDFNYYNGELEDQYRVEHGDTLLSWSATIGVFEWEGPEAALNQHIFRVDTSDEVNDIFYRFKLEHLLPRLEALSHGSTMKHLRKADLVNLQTEIPPIKQQRKIATILYNLECVIKKTKEIITQLEQVRKGITQDIFTTGYNSYDEYTQVRLGPVNTSIPKDWSVRSIPDYFEIIDGDRGKNYPSGSDFSDEGHCLFLSATNVTEEGLKFDETEFITQEKDKELRKGKLKRGDIIMTTRGTVGNFGLYNEHVDYDNIRINSGMVILRPKENVASTKYYYHFFRSGIFQKQINATSYGTAQPQTSVTDLKKMGVLDPGDEEKKEIAEIIENIVSEIQIQKEYRGQLAKIKQGLQQDLFSGTVRTTDTNIEVPDEIVQHG